MYASTSLPLIVSLATKALSVPATSTTFSYLPVTFTLHAGTYSINFTLIADGQTYTTNNDWVVTTIDGNGFDPYYKCNFDIEGEATLIRNNDGTIDIEPPQKMTAITCQPTPAPPDTCLPVYATCQWNSEQGGSYTLRCCSGYCAANKCRSTT